MCAVIVDRAAYRLRLIDPLRKAEESSLVHAKKAGRQACLRIFVQIIYSSVPFVFIDTSAFRFSSSKGKIGKISVKDKYKRYFLNHIRATLEHLFIGRFIGTLQ